MSKTWIVAIVIVILIVGIIMYFIMRKHDTPAISVINDSIKTGNINNFLTSLVPAGEKVLEEYIGKKQVNPSPLVIPIQAGNHPVVIPKDNTDSTVISAPNSSIYDIIGTSRDYKG